MCRLLGYLGRSLPMANLIAQPEHSLMAQSYQPREMTAGLLNADGFGIGWYDHLGNPPFMYKNTLPIWSDINLPHLNRYVQSPCFLANVRSATAGQPIDLSNCQPFNHGQVLGIHNGFIENFRRSLYRPLRQQLDDQFYQNTSRVGCISFCVTIKKLYLTSNLRGSMPQKSLKRRINRFDLIEFIRGVIPQLRPYSFYGENRLEFSRSGVGEASLLSICWTGRISTV